MTRQYDYHHTIYDLATIYDLYVPIIRPHNTPSHTRVARGRREHMARGCCRRNTGLGFGHTLIVHV